MNEHKIFFRYKQNFLGTFNIPSFLINKTETLNSNLLLFRYALNFIEKDKRDQELKIMTNDTLDYKMTQIVSIFLHSSALILITTCNCYFRRTLDQ